MPEGLRRRLVRLCVIVISVWLVLGTVGMVRAARYVGDLFPGFVWTRAGPVPFAQVNSLLRLPETPWWGGLADAISLPQAQIVAVDGRPITTAPDFDRFAEGDLVTFTLRFPGGSERYVTLPLRRFAFGHYFEFYGLFFLIGLTNTLAGLVLVHRATDVPTFLLGSAHLAFGGMGLQHSGSGCISTCTLADELFTRLVGYLAYAPSLMLAAVTLTSFALLYPRPLLGRHQMGRAIKWMLVVASVMTVVFAINEIRAGEFLTWQFYVQLVWIIMASLLIIGRSFHAAFVLRTQESLMLGWALTGGILLALLGGVLPFLNLVPIWLFTSLVYPASIIYPLIILYAVRNVALLHDLKQALELARSLENEVQEQKRAHAKALRQMANILHDSVLGDLKGVQFLTRAAARRLQRQDVEKLQEDLAFLDRTIRDLASQLRGVMEGMQPADFQRDGLVRTLERLFEARRRMYGDELEMRLRVDSRYDMLPPHLQEHVYWIVRAAMDNTRDHARATRFEAALSCAPEDDGLRFVIRLRDNGIGFDEEAVRAKAAQHGRYGLRNMRRRAEKKLGGTIRFETTGGTTVVIEFTHKVEEEGSEHGDAGREREGEIPKSA